MRHFALALALIASPAHSAAPSRDLVKAFAALQRDDARVNEIGYRLATGNAQYCRDARPTVGLLLLDAGAYNVPANIRAVLGISGDFAIQAVAKGSPAQSAGLAAGDELLELEGNRPDVLVRGVSPAEQVRLGFLHDEIEARLAESGSVGLRFGSRPVILKGIAACHAHFELATSGKVTT